MVDRRSRFRSPLEESPILTNLHQQLTDFKSKPDGSFVQKFELLPSLIPIEYHAGNGSFGGHWATLESKSVFQYETAIQWSIYACETGHPRGKFETLRLPGPFCLLRTSSPLSHRCLLTARRVSRLCRIPRSGTGERDWRFAGAGKGPGNQCEGFLHPGILRLGSLENLWDIVLGGQGPSTTDS